MSILAQLPIQQPRPLGGGGYTEVYAGVSADGPVVLKLARTTPRSGVDVTNGVFFAEGLARHTGSVGAWTPTPNEVVASEARQLAQLTHPAFPRLVTQGETQGRRWLIERFVPGRTWRQAIHVDHDARPAHVAELAKILVATQASGQLPFHGDLKPDNLLLDDKGQVRVLDPSSGLARVPPVRGAAPERLFTTPLYNPTLVASDVPSLGLLLAEVLCAHHLLVEAHEARPPVPLGPKLQARLAASAAVGTTRWTERLRRLPRPSELAAGVPPALEALALSCLGVAWDGRQYEAVEPPTLDALAKALAR
jgi:serine/threonine protein kinase